MTEKEWLECGEPQKMLEVLQKSGASARKLRLFAVACSRRMWAWIDVLGRTAVEVAENFADGLAGPAELRAARLACQGAGGQAAWYAAATNPANAARNAARSAQAGVANKALFGSEAVELLAQARLVREIFGDPFRPGVVDQSWLAWHDGSVVKLAQAIYEERAFERLPNLAAALEEAGCMKEDILAHCRQPGEHVRGCYVLDILLGKE